MIKPKQLLEIIAEKSAPACIGQMQELIMGMICNESQPMPLSAEEIYDAMLLEGEFAVFELDYKDVEKELFEKRLQKNISESLSILVTFEEDGRSLTDIESLIRYIHEQLDPLQNFRFGIKRADKLSHFPVKILFSGILPINQLQIFVGKEIGELLEKNSTFLEAELQTIRLELSEKIGTPILPLHFQISSKIPPRRVRLFDPVQKLLLCEFDVDKGWRDGLENYLRKLYLSFGKLGAEWRTHHPHFSKTRR